jgi:hypothetical protein
VVQSGHDFAANARPFSCAACLDDEGTTPWGGLPSIM